MVVLAVTALLIALALTSVTVLLDSGLRWWSAFASIRRELAAAPSADVRCHSRRSESRQSHCIDHGRRPAWPAGSAPIRVAA